MGHSVPQIHPNRPFFGCDEDIERVGQSRGRCAPLETIAQPRGTATTLLILTEGKVQQLRVAG